MIDDGTPRMSLRRGYVWVDLAASYRLTHADPTPGTAQECSRIPAGLTLEATRSPAQEMLSTVPVGGAVRLTLDQVPPWIVVHPSVDDLMVTRWPGRLLEVAVDEPSDADEIAAAHEINVGFVPSARHRRVLAVRVLADLDPACLFGPGGRDIVALLDRAATLTAQDVGGRSFDAERLERARRSVVTALLGASSPLVHPGILASPNDAPAPFGDAMLAAHSLITRQAVLAGGAHWEADDDDEDDFDLVFDAPWRQASDSLLAALWGLSAAGRADDHDVEVLLAPWRALVGREPDRG